MKTGLKQHVYSFVKEKYEQQYLGHAGMERILKHWEDQSKVQDSSWMDDTSREILLDIFAEQRSYLTTLNKEAEYDEDIIRQQIYQIDLEEERLKYI